jgi:hypothetical protein
MRVTIGGRNFFVCDNGGNVFEEHGAKHGVCGRQLFTGRITGTGWQGRAVKATPKTLRRTVTAWLRRNNLKGDGIKTT